MEVLLWSIVLEDRWLQGVSLVPVSTRRGRLTQPCPDTSPHSSYAEQRAQEGGVNVSERRINQSVYSAPR